ncbi:hypothetical protein LCGC14_1487460 [marine sediment metagenome]|uniref:Ribbon-helix-helix protein CopG domain-containing protein n=2 Tax=marine sediment metagenome TaxID=412755 RepID=A0A0F9J8H4_9ZZZZ
MAVMTRTSIMLPDSLKRNAEKKARSLGISLGEYIRRSIELSCKRGDLSDEDDPFIRDTKTYLKKSPKDSSMEHDKYIYG